MMADRMSSNRTPSKYNASLLLQPAASGFTLNQMAGNALLMPVSQQEVETFAKANSEEIDSFVGQSSENVNRNNQSSNEPVACTFFNSSQSVGAESFLTSSAPPSQGQHTNTDNQFAPVIESISTRNLQPSPPSSSSHRSTPSPNLSNTNSQIFHPPTLSSNQQFTSSYQTTPGTSTFLNEQFPAVSTKNESVGPSLSGPPPTGPSQNFRRTTAVTYVPPPGIQTSRVTDQSALTGFVTAPNTEFLTPGPAQTFSQFDLSGHAATASTETSLYQPNVMHDDAPVIESFISSNDVNSQQNALQNPQPSTHQNQTFQPSVPHLINNSYRPVTQHWFYCKNIESKDVWLPFSLLDSLSLEEAFISNVNTVATDGGRYDVTLSDHTRRAVYWDEENPAKVRRCSWFYKGDGERFIPYEETHSQLLEEAYKQAVTTNVWHKHLNLGDNIVTMHNPNVIVHTKSYKQMDQWGSVSDVQIHPRVVRRGVDEFDNIDDGEPTQIDHLVFIVHGIGAVCDLKFRDVVECVDDFRAISLMMMQSHFSKAQSDGLVGRVEFLPVKWHANLHGDATGIDQNMKPITLSSIPKLRHFANDTILDVLYYTSPVYCQTIIKMVCSEINRLFSLFISRNPHFNGEKSVIGHSLGSLILFDLLVNQSNDVDRLSKDKVEREDSDRSRSSTPKFDTSGINDVSELLQLLNIQEYSKIFQQEEVDLETLKLCSENDLKEMSIPLGPRKKILSYLKHLEKQPQLKSQEERSNSPNLQQSSLNFGQPSSAVTAVNYSTFGQGMGHLNVVYPKFDFSPSCFFALGSPIPMFLTIRGIQAQFTEDFRFPSCPAFFNIFHPYDPVAYRMEPIINNRVNVDPSLIPHHKGRKRLHLELKDSLAKYGSDIKQRVFDSIKSTWNSVYEFARSHQNEELTAEIGKVVDEQIMKQEEETETESHASDLETAGNSLMIGQLNNGRRIDYVLQEKPIESINQYLFALASHTCYWESEDTVLFILKEIYSLRGVKPNSNTKQEPRLQLYNPAAMSHTSGIPPERPPQYMPSPFSDIPQDTNHSNVQIPTETFNSPYVMTSLSSQGNSEDNKPQMAGPPPLTGFVRTQVRK